VQPLDAYIDSPWFLPSLLVVYAACIGLGYVFSGLRPPGAGRESRAISASIVMLMGLILTSTAGTANQTYQKSLDLQMQKVGAIAETWRRAQLLDPPERMQLTNSLLEYIREETRSTGPDRQRITDMHGKIWAELRPIRDRYPESPNTAQLLTAANRMIAMHWRVDSNARQRIPPAIDLMDLLGGLLVSVLVGYSTGTKKGRTWTVWVIYLCMVLLVANSLRTLGQLRSGGESAARENMATLQVRMEKAER
jgi:hypothetical protein